MSGNTPPGVHQVIHTQLYANNNEIRYYLGLYSIQLRNATNSNLILLQAY